MPSRKELKEVIDNIPDEEWNKSFIVSKEIVLHGLMELQAGRTEFPNFVVNRMVPLMKKMSKEKKKNAKV